MSDAAHATDASDAFNPGFVIAGGTALPTGELCNFTFTAGNTQKWYSRHGGENFGVISSGTPDVRGAGFVISRIWERGENTFQVQQSGGAFSDWVLIFPNASFIITTPNGVVTYTSAVYKTVGGSFITWRPTTAEQTILLSVDVGDSVNFVISTPAP